MKLNTGLVLVGVILLAIAAYQFGEGEQARSWAVADATVVASTVQRVVSNTQHPGSIYLPVVEYRYRVNGVLYVGDRISLGRLSYGSRAQAKAVASSYPRNKVIDIYYDPLDPNVSVINVGANVTHVVLLSGAGALFVIFGLFLNQIVSWAISVLTPRR